MERILRAPILRTAGGLERVPKKLGGVWQAIPP
jgi:hypothetical protein